MDDLDRGILRALQKDGAISHAELSEQVGASPASCWRRIKALEASGVLRGTVRLVDPHLVKRGVNIMCQVRIKSHTDDARREFESFISLHGEILECYSMSGEWDYLMRVVAADVTDYEKFLMRELLSHPSVVTAASHFALSQVKYTTALPV